MYSLMRGEVGIKLHKWTEYCPPDEEAEGSVFLPEVLSVANTEPILSQADHSVERATWPLLTSQTLMTLPPDRAVLLKAKETDIFAAVSGCRGTLRQGRHSLPTRDVQRACAASKRKLSNQRGSMPHPRCRELRRSRCMCRLQSPMVMPTDHSRRTWRMSYRH